MVDFNSDSAFTANKSHILELIVLGRRDELINTFQLYKENSLAQNSKADNLRLKLQSALLVLFIELDQALSRKLDNSVYDDMKKHLLGSDPLKDSVLSKYFFSINTALDELNLIKIDTKKKYDTTEIESENEQKGL